MSFRFSEKNVQQISDAEIIREVLGGHADSFEILIRRYNPYLYKIGRSYGFNHQDTEDLMQETFINCYVNLGQFAERSTFKTWLIKIMLHQCYQKFHKLSFQKEKCADLLPDNSSFMFSKNNHSDSDNAVINREFKKVIEGCLQKLPQHLRTTFALRELAGLNLVETAELMQVSTTNVKVRLNRAKATLRKEIQKIYSPDEIYEFNLIYCNKMVEAVMKKIAGSEKKY